MKKYFALFLTFLFGFTSVGAVFNDVVYSEDATIVPGEWTCRFNLAKAYAEENDLPLIVFWGNSGCPHCAVTEHALGTKEFVTWQRDRGVVMAFTIGGKHDLEDTRAAYQFTRPASKGTIPYVAVYWKGHDISGGKDKVCTNTPDKNARYMIDLFEKYLSGYVPVTTPVVGFGTASMRVKESVNDQADDWLEIPVVRGGDATGAVSARVTLDEDATTLYDYAANPRFEFEETTLDWADGDTGNRVVRVKVLDDLFYDGDGVVALKLELVSADNEELIVPEGKDAFRLEVTEDEKQAPGVAAVSGLDGQVGKANTIYVRDGEAATFRVTRMNGSDGLVATELRSSVPGVTFETDDPRDSEIITNGTKRLSVVYWSSREVAEKAVHVMGVPAGSTAKITLNAVDKFGVFAKSNTVSVTAVAADAPSFESDAVTETLYRYVTVSNEYPVVGTTGGALTFAKVSGALPSGLKVTANANGMVVSGVPTAADKSGARTFEAVYQVIEARGARKTKVPGLLVKLTYTVVDPALTGSAEGAPLDTYFQSGAHAYEDVLLLDAENGALAGVLTLTIPKATGKASAKLTCAKGKLSFAAKGWAALAPETGTYSLALEGTGAAKGARLTADVKQDGTLADLVVTGLATADYTADEVKPRMWSAKNPATDFVGNYVATMPLSAVTEAADGFAPRGAPYVTFKMTDADAKTGKMTWAGMLANGKKISGAAKVTELESGASVALPIFAQTKTDVFSAVCEVTVAESAAERTLFAASVDGVDVKPYWAHTEASKFTEAGDYTVRYDLVGGRAVAELANTQVSVALAPLELESVFGGLTMPNEVTAKVTAAGLVTGSATLGYVEASGRAKTVKASYAGVVTPGYDAVSSVSGFWYFTDKLDYEQAGRVKQLSVVRGAAVSATEAD